MLLRESFVLDQQRHIVDMIAHVVPIHCECLGSVVCVVTVVRVVGDSMALAAPRMQMRLSMHPRSLNEYNQYK